MNYLLLVFEVWALLGIAKIIIDYGRVKQEYDEEIASDKEISRAARFFIWVGFIIQVMVLGPLLWIDGDSNE